MEVVYTRLAKITYLEILKNLDKRWTKKEVKHFIILTNELLDKIKNNQIICPVINEKWKIRRGVIHKNVSLFYIQTHKKEKYIYLPFLIIK